MSRLAELTAEIEACPDFAGKRLVDIPGEPRALRFKWRWRFYRLAEANFAILIWNTLASLAPGNALWPITLALTALNSWMICFSEKRARICTRQLYRPAAEQLARDLLGMQD